MMVKVFELKVTNKLNKITKAKEAVKTAEKEAQTLVTDIHIVTAGMRKEAQQLDAMASALIK